MKSAPNIKKIVHEAYERHADALFRYCLVNIRDREASRDIVQDTFIKTWEYLSRSEDKIDNMQAFLFRVAKNTLIDYTRKKKSGSLDELMDDGFEPTSSFSEKEDKERHLDARRALETISQLDIQYREVLTLRYVEDMAVKEIADLLGEKENTVSVRIHRGISLLKDIHNYEQ